MEASHTHTHMFDVSESGGAAEVPLHDRGYNRTTFGVMQGFSLRVRVRVRPVYKGSGSFVRCQTEMPRTEIKSSSQGPVLRAPQEMDTV